MEKRVSRFTELNSLPFQIDKVIPQAGKNIVYARELLSVIRLDLSESKTLINSGAPIIGVDGITMTLAKFLLVKGQVYIIILLPLRLLQFWRKNFLLSGMMMDQKS